MSGSWRQALDGEIQHLNDDWKCFNDARKRALNPVTERAEGHEPERDANKMLRGMEGELNSIVEKLYRRKAGNDETHEPTHVETYKDDVTHVMNVIKHGSQLLEFDILGVVADRFEDENSLVFKFDKRSQQPAGLSKHFDCAKELLNIIILRYFLNLAFLIACFINRDIKKPECLPVGLKRLLALCWYLRSRLDALKKTTSKAPISDIEDYKSYVALQNFGLWPAGFASEIFTGDGKWLTDHDEYTRLLESKKDTQVLFLSGPKGTGKTLLLCNLLERFPPWVPPDMLPTSPVSHAGNSQPPPPHELEPSLVLTPEEFSGQQLIVYFDDVELPREKLRHRMYECFRRQLGAMFPREVDDKFEFLSKPRKSSEKTVVPKAESYLLIFAVDCPFYEVGDLIHDLGPFLATASKMKKSSATPRRFETRFIVTRESELRKPFGYQSGKHNSVIHVPFFNKSDVRAAVDDYLKPSEISGTLDPCYKKRIVRLAQGVMQKTNEVYWDLPYEPNEETVRERVIKWESRALKDYLSSDFPTLKTGYIVKMMIFWWKAQREWKLDCFILTFILHLRFPDSSDYMDSTAVRDDIKKHKPAFYITHAGHIGLTEAFDIMLQQIQEGQKGRKGQKDQEDQEDSKPEGWKELLNPDTLDQNSYAEVLLACLRIINSTEDNLGLKNIHTSDPESSPAENANGAPDREEGFDKLFGCGRKLRSSKASVQADGKSHPESSTPQAQSDLEKLKITQNDKAVAITYAVASLGNLLKKIDIKTCNATLLKLIRKELLRLFRPRSSSLASLAFASGAQRCSDSYWHSSHKPALEALRSFFFSPPDGLWRVKSLLEGSSWASLRDPRDRKFLLKVDKMSKDAPLNRLSALFFEETAKRLAQELRDMGGKGSQPAVIINNTEFLAQYLMSQKSNYSQQSSLQTVGHNVKDIEGVVNYCFRAKRLFARNSPHRGHLTNTIEYCFNKYSEQVVPYRPENKPFRSLRHRLLCLCSASKTQPNGDSKIMWPEDLLRGEEITSLPFEEGRDSLNLLPDVFKHWESLLLAEVVCEFIVNKYINSRPGEDKAQEHDEKDSKKIEQIVNLATGKAGINLMRVAMCLLSVPETEIAQEVRSQVLRVLQRKKSTWRHQADDLIYFMRTWHETWHRKYFIDRRNKAMVEVMKDVFQYCVDSVKDTCHQRSDVYLAAANVYASLVVQNSDDKDTITSSLKYLEGSIKHSIVADGADLKHLQNRRNDELMKAIIHHAKISHRVKAESIDEVVGFNLHVSRMTNENNFLDITDSVMFKLMDNTKEFRRYIKLYIAVMAYFEGFTSLESRVERADFLLEEMQRETMRLLRYKADVLGEILGLLDHKLKENVKRLAIAPYGNPYRNRKRDHGDMAGRPICAFFSSYLLKDSDIDRRSPPKDGLISQCQQSELPGDEKRKGLDMHQSKRDESSAYSEGYEASDAAEDSLSSAGPAEESLEDTEDYGHSDDGDVESEEPDQGYESNATQKAEELEQSLSPPGEFAFYCSRCLESLRKQDSWPTFWVNRLYDIWICERCYSNRNPQCSAEGNKGDKWYEIKLSEPGLDTEEEVSGLCEQSIRDLLLKNVGVAGS
ncbi:hypothetical protein CFIMG_000829RA [Ceratocystis fimbriata CBS 114723]|uniref:Nephrocystin 3-like N-terminal domain-containing protein n=1 Tax=Ceratocystis fimbriata CBS 114723 TaxID=1035309 RepID=A0A2C5XIG0_9PEZI|nr:hypothetical protein CFIMG_000829RA [Ceratocystis fimbriata CBS 114723]